MKARFNGTSLTPARIQRMRSLLKTLTARHRSSVTIQVVHDYTERTCGQDYTFERLEDGKGIQMQGVGGDIRTGDRILIRNREELEQYRVDAIKHNPERAQGWIALLHFHSNQSTVSSR